MRGTERGALAHGVVHWDCVVVPVVPPISDNRTLKSTPGNLFGSLTPWAAVFHPLGHQSTEKRNSNARETEVNLRFIGVHDSGYD